MHVSRILCSLRQSRIQRQSKIKRKHKFGVSHRPGSPLLTQHARRSTSAVSGNWRHRNSLLFAMCRWMASNDTCPICRAALTQQPLPPAPASCLPQQQQQQAGAGRVGVQQMADHRIEEELRFRLRSVQRSASDTHTAPFLHGSVMGTICARLLTGCIATVLAILDKLLRSCVWWCHSACIVVPCVPCGNLEALGTFGSRITAIQQLQYVEFDYAHVTQDAQADRQCFSCSVCCALCASKSPIIGDGHRSAELLLAMRAGCTHR